MNATYALYVTVLVICTKECAFLFLLAAARKIIMKEKTNGQEALSSAADELLSC